MMKSGIWLRYCEEPKQVYQNSFTEAKEGNEELAYFTGLFLVLFVSVCAKTFVYPLCNLRPVFLL